MLPTQRYLEQKEKSDSEIAELLNQFRKVTEGRKELQKLGDEIWEAARVMAARQVEPIPHNPHFATGSYVEDSLRNEAIQVLRDAGLWPLDGYRMQSEDLIEHSLLDAISNNVPLVKISKPKPQPELVKQTNGSFTFI